MRIERAPSDVFDFLARVENEVLWRQSITSSRYVRATTPAIGGAGETVAAMGSRAVTMRWTVVELDPRVHVAWELDGEPWFGGGSYTVTPTDRGTAAIVLARLEVRLHGAARILEPLLWAQLHRGLRGDLDRLRGLLERSAAGLAARTREARPSLDG